jgi:hypothetical protein
MAKITHTHTQLILTRTNDMKIRQETKGGKKGRKKGFERISASWSEIN